MEGDSVGKELYQWQDISGKKVYAVKNYLEDGSEFFSEFLIANCKGQITQLLNSNSYIRACRPVGVISRVQ